MSGFRMEKSIRRLLGIILRNLEGFFKQILSFALKKNY